MSLSSHPCDLPCDVPAVPPPQPLPSVRVRGVRQQDLANLAEVLASSFHAQEGWLGLLYPLLRMGIYEDLRHRSQLKTSRYACFVAVETGGMGKGQTHLPQVAKVPGWSDRIVGSVELAVRSPHLWTAQPKGYLYLSNLAVQTECRRQGIAQQLISACEQMALSWGFEILYLHVLEDNHAARRLYRKAGYQLYRVENNLGSWLMGHPRQLFLRKVLVK